MLYLIKARWYAVYCHTIFKLKKLLIVFNKMVFIPSIATVELSVKNCKRYKTKIRELEDGT